MGVGRVPDEGRRALAQIVLRAERLRALVLLALFGAFGALIAVRIGVGVLGGGAPTGGRSGMAVLLFVGTLAAVEWALYRSAVRRLADGRGPSALGATLATAAEVGGYTAGAALAVVGPGDPLDGSVVALLLFVALSAFRMSLPLSAFTGAAAAAGYLVLAHVVGAGSERVVWVALTIAGGGTCLGLMARAVREAAVRLAVTTEARERLQAELVASQADLLASVEATQARIGRELHDGVGSHLTGLSLFARGLVRRIERGEPVAAGEMGDAAGMVDDALRQVRRLSRGLTPSEMEPGGLPSALRDLAASASHASGLDVAFEDAAGGRLDVSHEAEAQLYRIAQEAVSNALRHAGATSVTVRLGAADGAVTLAVEDDGRGIADATGGGVGLRTMRHRAGLVGGTLAVEGRPGGGTLVAVRVPAGQ